MENKYIEAEFETFLEQAYKGVENISVEQIRDMRRVFFAGAFIMLKMAERAGSLPDENDGAAFLSEIERELMTFFNAQTRRVERN